MRWLVLALSLLPALLIACGQKSKTASTAYDTPWSWPTPNMSTATATATPNPPVLIGPLPQQDTILKEQPPGDIFVLDVQTGEVRALEGVGGDSRYNSVRWLDDESLLVHADQRTYKVSLDGTVVSLSATPEPSPTPQCCTSLACSACPGEPILSPDGRWTVANNRDGFVSLTVQSASEDTSFKIQNAEEPIWSPTDHLLAFNGNLCLDRTQGTAVDIFVFDPDSGSLTNLTSSLDAAALNFIWRPDGKAIAADVFVAPGDDPSLELIDVPSGNHRELLRVRFNSSPELLPIAWSSDARYLLVGQRGARGICDEGSANGSGPSPTAVEVIHG